MTTVNITTSTGTININNNTDQTINPNMYITTKVCKTCRTIKYVTEFYKNKVSKDGYSYKCKTCECQHKKTLYIINKNKILDQHKTYYEANKDKMLESGKEYRKLNKDKIKYQQQKYY